MAITIIADLSKTEIQEPSKLINQQVTFGFVVADIGFGEFRPANNSLNFWRGRVDFQYLRYF